MDKFKDSFTDLEKGKLFALCQDKVMLAALKKVLLADIYTMGVVTKTDDGQSNWAYNLVYQNMNGQMVDNNRSDEQLGQNLRGITMGITMLGTAFKRLEDFNVSEAPKTVDEPKLGAQV